MTWSMRYLAEHPRVFAEVEERIEDRWLHRAGEDEEDTGRSVSVDPGALPADFADFVVPEESVSDVPF